MLVSLLLVAWLLFIVGHAHAGSSDIIVGVMFWFVAFIYHFGSNLRRLYVYHVIPRVHRGNIARMKIELDKNSSLAVDDMM